eukprot:6212768-Pleurochrysis_carterae.AAC.3
MADSDTPAGPLQTPPGVELAVESGGRGSLPARTTARGINSSSTGLRSTNERSLVRAGSAGAKRLLLHHARQLLVCTRCSSFRAARSTQVPFRPQFDLN